MLRVLVRVMYRFTRPPKRGEVATAATGALKTGAVRIQSRLSVGSTFTITFPSGVNGAGMNLELIMG
jgi:hypothetical protein